MAFFRDVIGNWLNKRYAKALVLTIFLIYLGVASWGVITPIQKLSMSVTLVMVMETTDSL